ncbi:MFS transporter [Pokkaliibacter sp. CJK22405]|uniref:MFS transporter n=1 Tax=Pokkaliibacter sp. CJK22405 TaxID=3384615 RepID=UPI003984DBEA
MSQPSVSTTSSTDNHDSGMTPALMFFFAFCCGAIVANLYYTQPIIELIAPDLQMAPSTASLIVSITQIGYAIGMLFLVPLGDIVENRKFILTMCVVSLVSLVALAIVQQPSIFLLLSLFIGFSSVGVQLLIPLASHMTPLESRGRVVGNIMSGVIFGILLARPVASVIADHFGWRSVMWLAAAVMVLIVLVLLRYLPRREPTHASSYASLIRSLGGLVMTLPTLRHRAFYQGCQFAIFSMFWTAVPLELSRTYGISQSGIALFALVGAVGAFAAPIAGRLADAGHTKPATFAALTGAILCGIIAYESELIGVYGLALVGVLLDFCVQLNMVLGQRAIFSLAPEIRSRLNALYMTSIFVGGAIGSAIASTLYENHGWHGISIALCCFPLAALLVFLTKGRKI